MAGIIRDDVAAGNRGSELERFSASLARSTRDENVGSDLGSTIAGNGPGDPGEATASEKSLSALASPRMESEGSPPARASSGFATITEQMDRRSRESVAMVRLLQQNRQVLDAAETERDAAYAELARTIPIVQETAAQLAAALAATRDGKGQSGDLDGLFARNGDALADLETTAVALNVHFLRCRTSWEQYARSVDNAERLRRQGGVNP